MSDDRKIRDRRGGGWYYIHNAVYDMKLSCEALAMYNSIARFANNDTEKAYFSAKKFMSHHKIGTAKMKAAKAELIASGLIADTGDKTQMGAPYFELLEIGSATVAEGVGHGSRGGSATVADKQDLENNTNKDSLSMIPSLEGSKQKTKKKVAKVDLSAIEHLFSPIEQDFPNIKKAISHNVARMIESACVEYGEEFVQNAINGRAKQAKSQGKPLFLSAFFDPENAEWRATCAELGAPKSATASHAGFGL